MRKRRRLRSIILSAVLVLAVLGGGLVLKTIVLHQVRRQIENSLHFSSLRLTVLPPAIILEDVRSAAASPFFSAQKVVLRISYLSLFKRNKPLTVTVERPVLRIYDTPSNKPKGRMDLSLPFSIEQGFIRDAEIHYWNPGVTVRAMGGKGVFRQSKDRFVINLEAESSILFKTLKRPLTGGFRAVVEGRGNDLRVHQMTFDGRDVLFKVRGLISHPDDPEIDLTASLRAPADRIAQFLALPFRWGGSVEGQGRIVRAGGAAALRADLRSSDLVLNGEALGTVQGPLDFRQDGTGSLRLAVRRRGRAAARLELDIGRGLVEGRAWDFQVDPIIKDFNIPWPVLSPVTGRFSVRGGAVRVQGDFQDDPSRPAEAGRYAFRGPVDFQWDGRDELRFSSSRLETSFADLRVDGRIGLKSDLEVVLNGTARDAAAARAFTELVLRAPILIPEIRGRGETEVRIVGPTAHPTVKISCALAPGGFDRFDAASVSGLAEIAPAGVSGIFHVQDPDLRGEVRLETIGRRLEVRTGVEDARIETVLKGLDLNLPIHGRAGGEMTLSIEGPAFRASGRLASKKLDLAGVPLTDVATGLAWDGPARAFSLSDLKASAFGGTIRGGGRWDVGSGELDLDAGASEVALSSFAAGLEGRAGAAFKGRGRLGGEPLKGTFEARGLRFGTMGPVDAGGAAEIGLRGGVFTATLDGRLEPSAGEFTAGISFPEPNGSYLLNLKGRLRAPDLVLPWKGARGEIGFLAEVRGPGRMPRINGVVDFKGALLPIPNFPHALTDFTGLVRLQNDRAVLRSLEGRLAGGEVRGSGEARLGAGGLEAIDLQAEGRSMALALLDRTRTSADATLRLEGSGRKLALSGEIILRKLSWRRDLNEKFIFGAPSDGAPRANRTVLDDMTLDIRLRSDDNAVIDNALGRIQGRFDLTVSGTLDAPVLLGDVEGLRGEVFFQDRTFKVLRARLSFSNPVSIEPYLDFRGETFLKDYRVTFSMSGLLDRLRPEFASSPPLPSEDVLALLALGESFKRTYSYDVSSQMGTGSLLSFSLAEQAQKRAERLFSLDSIRIDPFVLGSSTEMTARLTVGKKISRNIILLYSTNLTSQREELIRLEWETSDTFSLVAMRDERGRLSLDAKVRKRF